VTTELAKWGNSLAVRIPRAVAERAGVAEGDRVSLEVSPSGDVVIRRARPRYSLDDLVGQITARNRHGATDWGGPRGRESW
jgi:antitoxin MazE